VQAPIAWRAVPVGKGGIDSDRPEAGNLFAAAAEDRTGRIAGYFEHRNFGMRERLQPGILDCRNSSGSDFRNTHELAIRPLRSPAPRLSGTPVLRVIEGWT
jgi:hypothetical protein